MSIIDSRTGLIIKDYTIKELEQKANYMRGMDLVAIHLAGSGHPGGTLSIMDMVAALYLKVAKHDPKKPDWGGRDRIIFSAGHKAPALYLGLGMAGYFPVEEIATLRQYDSPFQGHPHWLKLPGVEASTGSLGQGLGIGVGIALAAKLDRKDYKVYVVTGDGEWDEGSMWEAAMSASHHKLNNLIVIVDRNYLQVDGGTETVMKLDPLAERFSSFGLKVFTCDGHNMAEIIDVLNKARKVTDKPVVIIAKTIKGKGVSFMENVADWHGVAPNDEQLHQALDELGLTKALDLAKLKKIADQAKEKALKITKKSTPQFAKDYFWNKGLLMKAVMEPTRSGFGQALAKVGQDERVVCLGLDISGSVKISDFYKANPERKNRFLSMGIQEQNATVVAAGLAKEGKLPVLATYGVFISQRNADQMRTSVCYGEFNVLFGGAHGGISVGADGATHQSLEEIFVVGGLPNMKLIVPADSVETKKATEYCLLYLKGPKYIRFAREATPVISDETTPFVFGQANIIRLRKIGPDFRRAFDTVLALDYKNEGEEVTLIACGPEVPEAMRAAWILKAEKGIETRVINLHTIKPLDKATIVRAARETDIIITCEEHQKGGIGNLVAAAIMEAGLDHTPKFGMIGVNDRFGESGDPWQLMHIFGLSAEHIVQKTLSLRRAK
jgi:transketolase